MVKRVRKKDYNYYSNKKYDGMMGRCYRPSDKSYKTYGARGIKVCSAWIKDINQFRVWLLEMLNALDVSVEDFIKNPGNYQLDRIDPDGHYTPANCRISSPQNNTRNRRITKGKTIQSAEGDIYEF
jgi:hypothetical protein